MQYKQLVKKLKEFCHNDIASFYDGYNKRHLYVGFRTLHNADKKIMIHVAGTGFWHQPLNYSQLIHINSMFEDFEIEITDTIGTKYEVVS